LRAGPGWAGKKTLRPIGGLLEAAGEQVMG
jgi:hypothetical protein